MKIDRRDFLIQLLLIAGSFSLGHSCVNKKNKKVLEGIKKFIQTISNKDGSFRPGVNPYYKGRSDTELSGIAAPTYATIICKTFGWDLPYSNNTIDFFLSCQKSDGAFYAPTGRMDPNSPLAKLYNTVQASVALRLLGQKPKYDPTPLIYSYFEGSEFKDLPLYTTSFFALFFSAWGKEMPEYIDKQMREYIISNQQEDGYLSNHVASTFHAAHYFRLNCETTPKANKIVTRVLNDQKADGSWHLFSPDYDVHACFDALFILKQLGNQTDFRVNKAYERATKWILKCQQPDGGFSHFPGDAPSDMDAVYFHMGGLVQTGYLKIDSNIENEELLGWGHAMDPSKKYSCF
jgi:geranylgeranyl transferase type-2 subunit beta